MAVDALAARPAMALPPTLIGRVVGRAHHLVPAQPRRGQRGALVSDPEV